MNTFTIAAVAVVVGAGILLLMRRDRSRRIGGGPDRPPTPAPPRDDAPSIRQDPALDHLSDTDIAEIEQEIASGKKISAIKLVREKTGMGLKESKEFVEDITSRGRR